MGLYAMRHKVWTGHRSVYSEKALSGGGGVLCAQHPTTNPMPLPGHLITRDPTSL